MGGGVGQDAVVVAGLIGVVAFEAVEGREVADGVGEGDEFAVDEIPVGGGVTLGLVGGEGRVWAAFGGA